MIRLLLLRQFSSVAASKLVVRRRGSTESEADFYHVRPADCDWQLGTGTMEENASVVACVAWVRRGAAKEVPDRIKLDEENMRSLLQTAERDLR